MSSVSETSADQDPIRRVTAAIAARAPLSDVLAIVADAARDCAGASSVAVGLRTDSDTLLDFAAVSGADPREILGLQIRVDDSLAEEAVRTGQAVLVLRGAEDRHGGLPDRHIQSASAPDGLERRTGLDPGAPLPSAAAVVPVVVEGRVIGAIFARGTTDVAPVPDDLRDLLRLADLAGIAVILDRSARSEETHRSSLAALFEASHLAQGAPNVQAVLDALVDTVCRHVGHQAVAVFLLNDERTHLFIAAERGLEPADREVQLAADARVTASVLESFGARLVSDTVGDPGFDEIPLESRVRSALIAPIRGDGPLGLLIVTNAEPAAYTARDVDLVGALVSQAGIAIQNAWSYEDAARRAEETSALYELSQRVGALLDASRVCEVVASSVTGLLQADMSAVLLYDNSSDRLSIRASRGIAPDLALAYSPRSGEGIPGWVHEWMTPTAVADVAADMRNRGAPIDNLGGVSAMCVPMSVGDEVTGVVLALADRRRMFTVREMELLYTIANQAAVAISNAVLYEAQRAKSTGMRRYFRRVACALGAALGPSEAPQIMIDLAVEVLQADRGTLYAVTADGMSLRAASGFKAHAQADVAIQQGGGLAGAVVRRGKPIALEAPFDSELTADETWPARERISSYLGIPLKSSRRTVGVVEIATQAPRTFTADEVKLLTQFARRARIAERIMEQA